MSFIPATLRRSGYETAPQLCYAGRGFFGLAPRAQHSLLTFISGQPPRVVCELLLEVLTEGLNLEQSLRLMDQWRAAMPPVVLAAAGAGRFPRRSLRQVPSAAVD